MNISDTLTDQTLQPTRLLFPDTNFQGGLITTCSTYSDRKYSVDYSQKA